MTRDDVGENIGMKVTINGRNDLVFRGELRPFVNTNQVFKIIKLTRAGMAYIYNDDGIFLSVPPTNIDLLK